MFSKKASYTFFSMYFRLMNFDKNANSIEWKYNTFYLILFRDNLEFAFFGAMTSVVALFVILEEL